jgi:hypothetical protein
MYYGLFDLVCSNVPEEFNTVLVDSFFSIFIFLCSVFFCPPFLFYFGHCIVRGVEDAEGVKGHMAKHVLWNERQRVCFEAKLLLLVSFGSISPHSGPFLKFTPTFQTFPVLFPPPHTHFPENSYASDCPFLVSSNLTKTKVK